MEARRKRKYTVSVKVLAASRANLAKANAVPKSRRYRSTERRRAASARSLLRARAARQLRGAHAPSIEQTLEAAEESVAAWSEHRARFEALLGILSREDRACVRALAELAWRRLRAWRARQRREALRFYRRLAAASLGEDNALAFCDDLVNSLADLWPLYHDLNRLYRRMADLSEGYLAFHYTDQYDRPHAPLGRIARLLAGPVERMGNPWFAKSRPASAEGAASGPQRGTGQRVRAPFLLRFSGRKYPPVALPADYDEHLRRVQAVFLGSSSDPALAALAAQVAAVTWTRLHVLSHFAESESESLARLLPAAAKAEAASSEEAASLPDDAGYAGACQSAGALLAALPHPAKVWVVIREAGSHLVKVLTEWLHAAFGKCAEGAFTVEQAGVV